MSNQKTILLIEDDHFLSEIYQTKFELAGYKVIVEHNGDDGYMAAVKKHPDIVVLDVLLPGMNGFEVLQKLKEQKKHADIPVLLLTNLGSKDDVEKGIELGAEDYLIKAHFKPSEIVTKVDNILKNK